MIFNKLMNRKPKSHYDGLHDGYFVGWFSEDVQDIEVYIQGKLVAHGKCDQIRKDVEDSLGINVKGFRLPFDGKKISPDWQALDKLKLSITSLNDGKVAVNEIIDTSQLFAGVQFFAGERIEHQIDQINDSLLWDEICYCSQFEDERKISTGYIKDYILFGSKLAKDPSPYFSTQYYLHSNHHTEEVIGNPFIHYLTIGEKFGLRPNPKFSPLSYKELNPGTNNWERSLLAHYVVHRDSGGRLNDQNTNLLSNGGNKQETPDFKAHCDYVVLGTRNIMLVGWYLGSSELSELKLSWGDGAKSIAGKSQVLLYERPDVLQAIPEFKSPERCGFKVVFKLEELLEEVSAKNKLKIHFSDDEFLSINPQNIEIISSGSTATCEKILMNWSPTVPEERDYLSDMILPMLYEVYPKTQDVDSKRYDFGERINSPFGTVIIPLYGRFDFMRYQISNFSRFGSMDNIEVIYVVDDPDISKFVLNLAAELRKVFHFTFSVVVLARNVGFGGANNVGVEYATSDKLILLNSDVLPKDGEWAELLLNYLDTLPNVGMVGARLLFDDESIQHDGMKPYISDEYPDIILNDHPMKGLPVKLSPDPAEPKVCPLLTAACIAVKKTLYIEVGGFDPAYILGDFEDSDLCLKVLETGKINYICRDVVLNHLERLSQDLVDSGGWKHKVTIINANTYTYRWKVKLKEIFPEIIKEIG